MQRAVIKSQIPTLIAEKAIESNESGATPLVTPGVFSVLQIYFLQLAVVERSSEASHEREVDVPIVFISGLVDKVKVPQY